MTGNDSTLLLTALVTGFLSGTHCIGMCGGISAAFSFALPAHARKGWRILAWQLAYNMGRISTYTLLGLIVGLLAHTVLGSWVQSPWPRVIAGIFMIFLGLYLAGWSRALQKIEVVGGRFWKLIAPFRQKLLPINHPLKALLAGGFWGLLPCGLVYSMLTFSASRADPVMSAGIMLAFGLGTLPTLLVTGTAAGKLQQWLQHQRIRQLSGVFVILFGIVTLAVPLMHLQGGHEHGGHAPAEHSHSALPQQEPPTNHHDMHEHEHHHHE